VVPPSEVVDQLVHDPLDIPSGKVQISPVLAGAGGHQVLSLLGVGAVAGGGDGTGGLVLVSMFLEQLQLPCWPVHEQLSIVVVFVPATSHDVCRHPHPPLVEPGDNTPTHESPFGGANGGQEILPAPVTAILR
jgi:hypothetical protein